MSERITHCEVYAERMAEREQREQDAIDDDERYEPTTLPYFLPCDDPKLDA